MQLYLKMQIRELQDFKCLCIGDCVMRKKKKIGRHSFATSRAYNVMLMTAKKCTVPQIRHAASWHQYGFLDSHDRRVISCRPAVTNPSVSWKTKCPHNQRSDRLAHSSTTRKLTASREWWISRLWQSAARVHPTPTASALRPPAACGMLPGGCGGLDLPFPSVLASPGSPRSSRVGAGNGGPPSRSAAWRVQPPWVSQAGHWLRTKGLIRGPTRLPRWDSVLATA